MVVSIGGPSEYNSIILRSCIGKGGIIRFPIVCLEVYDLRKRPANFQVGQSVWRRNYVLSNAANYITAKLSPKFIGPFIIKKKLGLCTYELMDPETNTFKGTWHAKDLRPNPDDVEI